MCLRSPRAFKPPLSLIFHLSLRSLSFTSSPYVRSSLLCSFVGRFSPHRFFLSHVRIKTLFQRIIGFTLLSTLLSFSLSLFSLFFCLPRYLYSHRSLSPRLSGVELISQPLFAKLRDRPRRQGVSARIPVSGPPNTSPLLLLRLPPPLLPSCRSCLSPSSRRECRSTLYFLDIEKDRIDLVGFMRLS